MKRLVSTWLAVSAIALVCAVAPGGAQAANILASETAADVATLVGTQFDVTAFTSTSNGESADGSGAFLANQTATGSALVVLTEGPGGPASDWFQLVYSGGFGGFGTETVTAHWRSDADPGGLPALPPGPALFLVETGGVQDITALLALSATASGFEFPSNITIQVQSDAPEVRVPEPASLVLVGSALLGLGFLRLRRRRG